MGVEVIKDVKTGIAFVGTGWIGLNRMKALLDEDLVTPVAVMDADIKNARKAAELAEDAVIYRDYTELLNSRPEAVVIATPNALHAEQCIKALERGIAVFCQKPLARTAEETMKVISAAYVSNRLLGVDFSYRFTDGMQKIYNEARSETGQIYAVDLVFNNAYGPDKSWFFNPKLSGGGCLIDLGVHMIDLALWMLDFPEVTSVWSSLFSKGRLIDSSREVVEDYVAAQFETQGGAVVRLTCSWNLPAGQDAEIRASFYGTRGSALFYNVNGSFYDFEAAICHGTSRKVISSPPDSWGGRALVSWTNELIQGKQFRKEAFHYYDTAEVIDRIYKRNIGSKPIWDENITNSR